jgi:outer membrane immunogenic protein
MQRWRAVVFAFLISTLLVAPGAVAADLGDRRGRPKIAKAEPVPLLEDARPFSWNGFYIGIHAGYAWSDIEWSGAFTDSQHAAGWLGGGQIGYNWQRGRLVYGVETDVSSGWIDGGSGCCTHTLEWLYSVRGRAGIASYDNRWLLYATGGVAWADIDYASAGFSGHSDTHFGWVVGGGVERALTQRLAARLEYLYYDFDSVSAPAGALGGGVTELDPSTHVVRFGLNLKF